MAMFFGIGATGKSTLIRVLLSLLGDCGRQARAETLMVKRSEAVPSETMSLV